MTGPVLCGRRHVTERGPVTSCVLRFGHDGQHEDRHGQRWAEPIRAPHLWVTPDAMGWGP